MSASRTKNIARNLVFATISKVYNLLVPFVMRTAMIYLLGMEYLGLNSLFTSILSVLSLAELGVGSALTFSMYKPIAEDDTASICALMRLYKIYYRVIGLVILVLGIAVTPFLPYLIKQDLPPDVNLYVLYYINLLTTVISYWLFAYKNCLLFAHQRNDIGDKISMVISTVQYGIQLAVLFAFKNYYLYIIAALLMGAVKNIVTSLIVDRMYPHYKAVGKLPKEQVQVINRRVRDLFTAKIGSIVYDSADTIVISSFLGLTALAVYQNYFYIMNTVFGFVTLLTTSSLAGVGNSLVVDSEQKNFYDLKKFTFIISWLSAFCICCLACLYQPFMELWVGKENMLPYGMVILICIYFYIRQINNLLNFYKDAAGMWHEDRWRPLAASLTNLVVNLILVQFWGLYGILTSTVVAMLFVGMPWLFHNLFSVVFHCSPKRYILSILGFAGLIAALTAACIGICHFITFDSLILTFLVRLVICAVVSNAVCFVLFRKNVYFKDLVGMLVRLSGGKLKFLERLVQ